MNFSCYVGKTAVPIINCITGSKRLMYETELILSQKKRMKK